MCDIDMTDEALSSISHTPLRDSCLPPRCPRLSPLSLGKRSRDNDHFRTEPLGDADMHMDHHFSTPRSPTTPVSKKTKRARFASDAASPRPSSRIYTHDDADEVPGWAPQHPRSPPPPTPTPSVADEPDDPPLNGTLAIHLERPPTPVTYRRASRYLSGQPLALTHPQLADLNSFSAPLPLTDHAPFCSDSDGMEETTPTLTRTAYFGPSYYSAFPDEELQEREDQMEENSGQSSLSSSISSSSSWHNFTSDGPYQPQFASYQDHYSNSGLIAPRPVPAHIPLLNDDSFFPDSALHYSLAPGHPHSHYTYSSSSPDVFDHPTRSSMRPSSTSSYSSISSTESPFLSSTEEGNIEDDDCDRSIREQTIVADDIAYSEVAMQERKWFAGEWFEPPTEFADMPMFNGRSMVGQLHRRRDSENEGLDGQHFGFW